MTGKERLTAALNKKPVDRLALNFYEIGGFDVECDYVDPFNIYNSDSWRELIAFTEQNTDLIRMRTPEKIAGNPLYDQYFKSKVRIVNGSRITTQTLKIGSKEFISVSRRDPDVDTIWNTKHLLKDAADIRTFLELPDDIFDAEYSVDNLFLEELHTGDKGLVMVDTEDPLATAAQLFNFEDFTILALTEQSLFHKLLEKISVTLYKKTEFTAKNFPGRLWRIYGPEYASEPYLPPNLFKEYVQKYTGPMVKIIQASGGKVRLHSHGRLRNILDMICEMGVDAIDPIEPPPQGDVDLEYLISNYGKVLTMFGNLEIADIENMPPKEFEKIARASIETGRNAPGFVLMPSASPYGRVVSENTLTNYRNLLQFVQE